MRVADTIGLFSKSEMDDLWLQPFTRAFSPCAQCIHALCYPALVALQDGRDFMDGNTIRQYDFHSLAGADP